MLNAFAITALIMKPSVWPVTNKYGCQLICWLMLCLDTQYVCFFFGADATYSYGRSFYEIWPLWKSQFTLYSVRRYFRYWRHLCAHLGASIVATFSVYILNRHTFYLTAYRMTRLAYFGVILMMSTKITVKFPTINASF
jgi:hypothetical protein